jgi:NAD(P)-dependent dehydrogenase (short-subunit alcohol dehydrogenase family)
MKPLALITGGHTGIGFGIAQELVKANFAIALISETPVKDQSVQFALNKIGSFARYYQHDLRDISNIPNLLDQIEANQGSIHSLISNAGVSALVRDDMLQMNEASYDFVMDINLKGTFFLAQETARRIVSQKVNFYRSMIFITSVSATMVSKERAEYCISKAGASMMVKLFCARLSHEGIGVFDLRPGIIETPMTSGVKDQYNKKINEGLVPVGRWGQPSDIGSVVLPLVQGKMAYATGAVIPIDGGLSLNRL